METLYGGIEGGGTKFVCLLGPGPDHIVDEERFPTTTPDETLGRVVAFFRRPRDGVRPAALAVSSFGPLDGILHSPTCGSTTTTPKQRWAYTDVVGLLQRELGVPLGWDTDVNVAAIGEWRS